VQLHPASVKQFDAPPPSDVLGDAEPDIGVPAVDGIFTAQDNC
jgi:hypothetical protein